MTGGSLPGPPPRPASRSHSIGPVGTAFYLEGLGTCWPPGNVRASCAGITPARCSSATGGPAASTSWAWPSPSTGRASFWFIAAMCVLMVGVGWSYEIICRLFPDGGGVYSSARHRSQLLAVIGGLLLCADYVVTASLSCLDAFHYLGRHRTSSVHVLGLPIDAILAAVDDPGHRRPELLRADQDRARSRCSSPWRRSS